MCCQLSETQEESQKEPKQTHVSTLQSVQMSWTTEPGFRDETVVTVCPSVPPVPLSLYNNVTIFLSVTGT